MRNLSKFGVVIFACSMLLVSAAVSPAEVVRVNYTANAATVVGMPFGLDVPRLTVFTGYFEFDNSTPDDNPTDETTGLYRHMNAGGFVASFLTHEITGSDMSVYELDSDAQDVRITDGPDFLGSDGGPMSLDGDEVEDLEMFVGFGTEFVLVDDSFVNPFMDFDLSFVGTPHTFRLRDGNGTVLLQFDTLETVGATTTTSTTMITVTTSSTTTTTTGEPKLCGDPVAPPSAGVGASPSAVTASDALFVLSAAVGAATCDLCVCDVNDSGTTTASDALALLQAAVGQPITLVCPPCTS